jgi:hypothetical protein
MLARVWRIESDADVPRRVRAALQLSRHGASRSRRLASPWARTTEPLGMTPPAVADRDQDGQVGARAARLWIALQAVSVTSVHVGAMDLATLIKGGATTDPLVGRGCGERPAHRDERTTRSHTMLCSIPRPPVVPHGVRVPDHRLATRNFERRPGGSRFANRPLTLGSARLARARSCQQTARRGSSALRAGSGSPNISLGAIGIVHARACVAARIRRRCATTGPRRAAS